MKIIFKFCIKRPQEQLLRYLHFELLYNQLDCFTGNYDVVVQYELYYKVTIPRSPSLSCYFDVSVRKLKLLCKWTISMKWQLRGLKALTCRFLYRCRLGYAKPGQPLHHDVRNFRNVGRLAGRWRDPDAEVPRSDPGIFGGHQGSFARLDLYLTCLKNLF